MWPIDRRTHPLRLAVFLLCLTAAGVEARERIVVGGDAGTPWQEGGGGLPPVFIVGPGKVSNSNTPGGVINFATREGWMFPESADPTENIALQLADRGGSVTAPSVLDDLSSVLVKMIDNDANTAFERKGTEGRPARALGVILQFDLGARFGVSRLRFFPRNAAADYAAPGFPFQDDFLKAFEIFFNDGRKETQVAGLPVFTSVLLKTQNDDAVVDVTFEPQYVRSIQLKSLTTVGFEVAEMQVFGEGFVPTAVYHSDIFDMGSDLAVWGNLDWEEDSEGDPIRSRAAISTRSGRDSTPVVFRRIRSDGEDVPWKAADTLPEGSAAQQLAAAFDATSLDVREAEIIYRDLSVEERDAISLTQDDYSSLRSAERGSVRDDLDNWSTWSPPYRLAGVRIVSPSPRRYFQFNVDYSSEDLFSAKGLGSLSFDFTSPSLAEQIIAEIRPRQADLGQTTDFSLVIVPELRPSVDRGFNSIVVSTPVRVLSLGRVHMTLPDGTQLEEDFSGADLAALPVTGATFAIVEVADDHFQIDLPLVEASRLGPGQTTILEVDFACVVLRTGTEFTVEAMLEGADEVPQRALAGNARILSQGGITVIRDPSKLAVQVEKRGGLLTNVGVSHRVITPNGDGANDVTSIRFDITDLTSGGDVDVRIYDLSGRLVRVVDTGRYASGRFARDWDGTDRQGNTVPPGIYLYTVGVNADAGDAARSGTIAVAY